MIISIDWLKDFIDIDETPEELSNMLSSLGLEAECDNQFGDIKDVVIGEVISVSDHPNADRLNVCMVSDCLLYTSPSPRDLSTSRMPSSA